MLGIAAIGFSAFAIIAGYLPIFEAEPEAGEAKVEEWDGELMPPAGA
jgi:hypothetical protein